MSGDADIAQPTPLAPASRDAVVRPAAAAAAAALPADDGGERSAYPETAQSPAFPLSLQFDPETHRVMIESRDPVTGFVVFQVPPKTAIRAIAGASVAFARGKRVDSEA
ncbi:MAG TPA: hypothetical protein VMG55_13320 [Stellaceae bacterium]|nr:hypothetical protein [Stellaceae bacterium]